MPTTFDPDSYLAKPTEAFDPDAYLQSLPEVVYTPEESGQPIGEIPGRRRSWTDIGQGIVEVPGVLATGLVSELAGHIAGPIVSMQEGSFGTQKGVRRAEEIARYAQNEFTYAPRTQTGRDILSGLSGFFDTTKLAGLNPYAATELGVLGSPVLQQGRMAANAKSAERAAAQLEKQVAQSFDNAAQIDAAKLAVKHGIALNPAESNPTNVNRLKSTLSGTTNLNENLSKLNEVKITNLVKQDMGLPANTVLNAKAFETALAKHSAPYDTIKKIPQIVADESTLKEIQGLRIERPSIGGKKEAAAVNELVDDAVADIKAGRSGAEILTDIRKLRKNAKDIYTTQEKSGVPDPALLAKAETNLSIANALENLIEANVSDPKLLKDFRQARAEMAKIYSYERATNVATHRVDPQILAKMLDAKKPLSGMAADIAKIAAVFPDVTQSGKTGRPFWAPERLTRSGTAGTIGYGIGSALGSPVLGAVLGAASGNVASGLAGRRIATPGYQLEHALPKDYRGQANKLRPAAGGANPQNLNNLRND